MSKRRKVGTPPASSYTLPTDLLPNEMWIRVANEFLDAMNDLRLTCTYFWRLLDSMVTDVTVARLPLTTQACPYVNLRRLVILDQATELNLEFLNGRTMQLLKIRTYEQKAIAMPKKCTFDVLKFVGVDPAYIDGIVVCTELHVKFTALRPTDTAGLSRFLGCVTSQTVYVRTHAAVADFGGPVGIADLTTAVGVGPEALLQLDPNALINWMSVEHRLQTDISVMPVFPNLTIFWFMLKSCAGLASLSDANRRFPKAAVTLIVDKFEPWTLRRMPDLRATVMFGHMWCGGKELLGDLNPATKFLVQNGFFHADSWIFFTTKPANRSQ